MMKQNDKIVKDTLVKQTAKNIVQVDYGDFQQLKVASNQFIEMTNEVVLRYERDKNFIAQNQTSIKQGITTIYKFMRDSTNFTQDILQLQNMFEIQLNNFLGRIIYLTWVSDDGQLNYVDEADVGTLYKNYATANRGRGNISQSQMRKFLDTQNLEGLNEQLQKKLKVSESMRNQVYMSAIGRWAANNTEEKKKYSPSEKTFYWRLHDHHITGWTDRIQTKGIIAEGYAGAVINEDPNVTNADIQTSLKNLYLNHIQKDSVGAAIKGDIVLKSNGNIQFAIKQGSFSTARFGQYLRLAYNIQRLQQITVKEFEEYLPKLINLNKATNDIIQWLNNKAENASNQTIAAVQKNLTK